MTLKRLALSVAVVLMGAVAAVALFVPPWLDEKFNRVTDPGPYRAGPDAEALHARLTVADLHADALLWSRNLLRRSAHGHVDVPRLIDGNVALQVFAAVTQVPRNRNYTGNTGDSDQISSLVLVQGWPVATWNSLAARTLYQADKLHRLADSSGGKLTVITSRRELDTYLARRAQTPDITAGLLAIEGLHALEGKLENLDAFIEAGYRMMAPTHFFDTEVSGSAHGVEQYGLTKFGRTVITRMQERGILVDLAHASPKTIDDVLDMATAPVVVSHTGVQGTCEGPRNLSDTHIRRIAETGGIIGIGFWEGAVCGTETHHIVRAMRYVADLVGVDHVALGSDYDGTVLTKFDASGLVLLTEALMKDGFTEDEIARMMGGNVMQVLKATLPVG